MNVDGYYNSLLALFDKGVEEGFIEKSARQIVVSSETAEELVRKMEVHTFRNLFLLLSPMNYSDLWIGCQDDHNWSMGVDHEDHFDTFFSVLSCCSFF